MVTKKSKTSPTKKVNMETIGFALKNFWVDYTGWGRANRAEYWWVYLFYCVIFPFAVGIIFAITAGVFSAIFDSRTVFNIFDLLSDFVSFCWWGATLVPMFCLGARRLHDTNRSAWNLCWGLLPIVGWILLIVFMCQKGDAKANRFGAPRM